MVFMWSRVRFQLDGSDKLQVTSYKLQATSYKLQAASYKLQATSCKLRARKDLAERRAARKAAGQRRLVAVTVARLGREGERAELRLVHATSCK